MSEEATFYKMGVGRDIQGIVGDAGGATENPAELEEFRACLVFEAFDERSLSLLPCSLDDLAVSPAGKLDEIGPSDHGAEAVPLSGALGGDGQPTVRAGEHGGRAGPGHPPGWAGGGIPCHWWALPVAHPYLVVVRPVREEACDAEHRAERLQDRHIDVLSLSGGFSVPQSRKRVQRGVRTRQVVANVGAAAQWLAVLLADEVCPAGDCLKRELGRRQVGVRAGAAEWGYRRHPRVGKARAEGLVGQAQGGGFGCGPAVDEDHGALEKRVEQSTTIRAADVERDALLAGVEKQVRCAGLAVGSTAGKGAFQS